MEKQYIMLKDNPVLEINNYTCKILDYDHLPYALRYDDVNYDDVMHSWTEMRTMSISKTNGKKILAALNISQNNAYAIAKYFHFATLTDSYWIKTESEDITWKDVSMFHNTFEKTISNTALFGENAKVPLTGKIHSPEPGTLGMAAKAWVREKDEIYLYKVAKREVVASKILDALEIDHVPYEFCSKNKLRDIASEDRIRKIEQAGEAVVKSKIITSEDVSIINWEDFAIYCERHDINPYKEAYKYFGDQYDTMQVADYILANDDRHIGNYGFMVDNASGQIINMYPLMDHDHAFSDEPVIYSQTTEKDMELREAAKESLKNHHLHINFRNLIQMEKPEGISDKCWNGILNRTKECQKYYKKIHEKELDCFPCY